MNLFTVSILGSALVVGYWLWKGKKTVLDFCIVVGGVAAIFFIATQWGWLGPLLGFGSTIHQTSIPVLPSTSHIMHHGVVPSPQVMSLPVSLQDLLHTAETLGSMTFVLLLSTIVVLLSRRRRYVSPLLNISLCSECGEESSSADYQWKNGRGRVRGKLCVRCINKLHARVVL